MKKLIYLILFVAVVFTSVNAQEEGYTRFSFVLNPQISWLKTNHESVDAKGSLPGYNFGIIVDRFFGENYAFCTGLTINTNGGKLQYPEVLPNLAYTQTYRLKYLEIPLGLKLRSEDMHRTNFYGRFGLSPQINIKAVDNNGKDISDQVKLFDLGYHLGAGIEYSVGSRNALLFGLLFNNGFADITKKNGFEDKTIHNRFVFEFGFIF
jgi:hypothetical protein